MEGYKRRWESTMHCDVCLADGRSCAATVMPGWAGLVEWRVCCSAQLMSWASLMTWWPQCLQRCFEEMYRNIAPVKAVRGRRWSCYGQLKIGQMQSKERCSREQMLEHWEGDSLLEGSEWEVMLLVGVIQELVTGVLSDIIIYELCCMFQIIPAGGLSVWQLSLDGLCPSEASCLLPLPRCGFVCSGHIKEYTGRRKQRDWDDAFCVSPLLLPFPLP